MTVQPAPIPEVVGVDRDRFENEIVPAGRPVVVRGLVAGWPAAKLGRQSPEAICKYLIERDTHAPIDAIMLPPEEKGRIFYNAAMDGFNFFRTHQTISRVIEQIARYSAFPTAPAVAAQSALIRSCLPRFLDENPMPLLDAAEPRIWIGNAIIVPAHFDDANNIACVVAGRRRFTLFPPEQIANLYIGPVDFAPTGAPISMVDFAAPDLERFPRFAEARAQAVSAELGPGDAIFIPPLWWHHVQSLERLNMLVNYWWTRTAPGWAPPPSALDALLHVVATLRALPPAQRAAWRHLFEHYVFDAERDVAGHIPPERRSLLGALSAEEQKALRAVLVQRMSR